MLIESFIVSVLGSDKTSTHTANKDIGIYIYEYQPQLALKSTFKKSSTKANCLAVSASHIFAAQTDKAVVHIYNRERGNLEAVIPFSEKICSLALIGRYDGAGTLALGTEGGRLLLWELCTGRLVSTPQAHLQAVNCLTVDPSHNSLLSGSPDSNVHVWSIPALLCFNLRSNNDPNQTSILSPSRTLSHHRAAVVSIITGHSSCSTNIAISASQDNTCLIWDYHSGTLLHTYLLPTTPLCLALDPADRAFYAGFEDGSIQMIDFYKRSSLIHEIYDSNIRTIPIQPSPADRWSLAGEATSAAYCLDTSYDGTTLVSGHQNGTLHAWDTAKGRYGNQVSDLFSSVMNLHLLPPSGFPNQDPPNARLLNVVKPRYESSLTSNNMSVSGSGIPENYTFTAQFASMIRRPLAAHDLSLSFERALDHASFPDEFFEEGLTELAIWSNASESKTGASTTSGPPDDLQKEIARLKVQLRFEKSSKQVYMVRTVELGDELRRRDNVERNKRRMKKLGRLKRANMETERRNTEMGTVTREGESVMDTGGDDKEAMNEEYSSSTEELTGSELGR